MSTEQSRDRLITVSIHTYDKAVDLKALLEKEGVDASLQNVNLSSPVVSSGVRVRIHESDLPLALRIIENRDIFESSENRSASSTPTILVPIDFSSYSTKACEAAFRIAYRKKASIELLHSYSDPSLREQMQLKASLNFDDTADGTPSPDDMRHSRVVAIEEARKNFEAFSGSIIEKIKAGVIPGVKFSTEIIEGIPEECINQKAKELNPMLIVMGTRGIDAKERELVGSVTAEVLDTCRYPVFTVPDAVDIESDASLNNILFLSNFDQEDILALDALFHLLPIEHLNVTLVGLPSKKRASFAESQLNALGSYCRSHYPAHHFAIDAMSMNSIDDDFARIAAETATNLIAVPNKKKNIFARLFNPGIAHRLLFHSDIPMIVIPV